jgi:hypothetical protein
MLLTCQKTDTGNVKLDVLSLFPPRVRDENETDRCDSYSDDGDEPEDPSPSGVLNEDGTNEYSKNISDCSSATEQCDSTRLRSGLWEELDNERECRWDGKCTANATEGSENE